jgi:hypothetical protein
VYRLKNLDENILGYVFAIFVVLQKTKHGVEYKGLPGFHQFLEGNAIARF